MPEAIIPYILWDSTVLNSDNAACCELEPGWCLENWPQAKAACHLTSSDKIWDKGTKVQKYRSSKVGKIKQNQCQCTPYKPCVQIQTMCVETEEIQTMCVETDEIQATYADKDVKYR